MQVEKPHSKLFTEIREYRGMAIGIFIVGLSSNGPKRKAKLTVAVQIFLGQLFTGPPVLVRRSTAKKSRAEFEINQTPPILLMALYSP